VSFTSEPGRDDGSLPPVNIVIPDDARELDRDVLAYHRELRARHRRERMLRLFAPLNRRGFCGHVAILPLIATCLALSMLAGAMLSVLTISPAQAPTVPTPPGASSGQAGLPSGLTSLPAGTVELKGKTVPVRSLVTAALALIPAACDCGQALRRLADQAIAADVSLYFAGTGAAAGQVAQLAAHYGGGVAFAVYDRSDVLGTTYQPSGLTVLLVYHDATAQVRRALPADFQLGTALRALPLPGRQALYGPAR
jgi:hypothetical protein